MKRKKPSKLNATAHGGISYQDCSLGQLCLMMEGRHITNGEAAEPPLIRKRMIKKRDYLYRTGEPFLYFFVITKGAIKTTRRNENGRKDILGFYLPGELLGAEAISIGNHSRSAQAIVDTFVCEVPYEQLSAWVGDSPAGRVEMMRIMGGELHQIEKQNEVCRKRSTAARLAAFFMEMSKRMGTSGAPTMVLELEMARGDIASYLRIAPETISRLFRRFQEEGLILADDRQVQLLNVGELHSISQLDSN